MSNKIKSHLLIGNKFLGSLLYFKDASGRGCLKLSFKNKIADFVVGSDVPTTLPAPAMLTDPITLDVSYKFEDSLLEVKKMLNGKPDRTKTIAKTEKSLSSPGQEGRRSPSRGPRWKAVDRAARLPPHHPIKSLPSAAIPSAKTVIEAARPIKALSLAD